jgi:hypothetical protein
MPSGENALVWSAGLRVLRLANPLVRLVLDSRAHALLSGRLVLLAYRGQRSGREFRIPLRYAEAADRAVVTVAVRPERKQWWRSFSSGRPATLTLRGKDLAVRGRVVVGAERDAALRAYLDRYPRSRRLTEEAAAVVFQPVDG